MGLITLQKGCPSWAYACARAIATEGKAGEEATALWGVPGLLQGGLGQEADCGLTAHVEV